MLIAGHCEVSHPVRKRFPTRKRSVYQLKSGEQQTTQRDADSVAMGPWVDATHLSGPPSQKDADDRRPLPSLYDIR